MLRIYSPQDRVPAEQVRVTILRVRQNRKLTQGMLAQKLGVGRKIIERIEQGEVQTVNADLARKVNALDDGQQDGE